MTGDSHETEAAWRNLSWTLIIVLLVVVLIVAAVPWIARQAAGPAVAALSDR